MMTTQHPASGALKDLLKGKKPVLAKDVKPTATLDSADAESGDEAVAVNDYTTTDIRLKTAAGVQVWAETSSEDLGEGEGVADRLFALLVGIADQDMNGEISEAEQAILDVALESAWAYLSAKGVSDEDLDLLLNEWDNDAGERVQELVAGALPDGEKADDDLDAFAFDGDSDASALDSAVLDASYKKAMAIRGGKKVRINKRISGTVRLTAKQKVAIRKAQMKSHSAGAMMKRMKSMRVRKQMGM
jgi:hypothetical protein